MVVARLALPHDSEQYQFAAGIGHLLLWDAISGCYLECKVASVIVLKYFSNHLCVKGCPSLQLMMYQSSAKIVSIPLRIFLYVG